ncbi:MAG: hypothetical protein L0H81_00180 [Actinomyces sp.]|nr:hypothetical protein [Actinomyces sp.]MDN6428295.1 hypothetical protein [Propionibacterium sp.]
MSLDIERIVSARVSDPDAIAEALARRRRPVGPPQGKFLVIAADHPARGALRAGADPVAMEDRWDLLGRIVEALAVPGVEGYLGTADTIEDLALLGALESKHVFGSMNRGGLAGASFEMDDRMTGYDVAGITEAGLDGGKMLLRVDPDDDRTASTLQACAQAVSDLGRADLVAMVEPFISRRDESGRVVNKLDPESVALSAAIASGLGASSRRTWLKMPLTANLERLSRATTLPIVVLGGEVSNDPDATFARWEEVLSQPNVIGLVIGRSLLYPPSGSVTESVNRAVSLPGLAH